MELQCCSLGLALPERRENSIRLRRDKSGITIAVIRLGTFIELLIIMLSVCCGVMAAGFIMRLFIDVDGLSLIDDFVLVSEHHFRILHIQNPKK